MARPVPGLYRISRALRRVGLVILVIILVYVAAVIYSASQIQPTTSGGTTTAQVDPNGTAQLTTDINLSNPGYFAFSALHVALELRLPNGSLVGTGGSPIESFAGGTTGRIPVTFWMPLTGSSTTLLTHDLQLPMRIWLNLTYASLFSLNVGTSQNYSWGAPLARFNATPGNPTAESNGTVLLPVAVSFANDATFGLTGNLGLVGSSSAGVVCLRNTVDISTPAHGSFDQTLNLYFAPSCSPAGGSLALTYTGMGVTYAFPTQRLP